MNLFSWIGKQLKVQTVKIYFSELPGIDITSLENVKVFNLDPQAQNSFKLDQLKKNKSYYVIISTLASNGTEFPSTEFQVFISESKIDKTLEPPQNVKINAVEGVQF